MKSLLEDLKSDFWRLVYPVAIIGIPLVLLAGRAGEPLCQSVQDNRDLDPRVADAGPSAAGLGVQSNPPFVGRFLHDRSSPFDTATVS